MSISWNRWFLAEKWNLSKSRFSHPSTLATESQRETKRHTSAFWSHTSPQTKFQPRETSARSILRRPIIAILASLDKYLEKAFWADFDKNCQFGQSNSLKSSSRCRYRVIQEKLTRKHYFQRMTKIWNFSNPKLHNWASARQTQIWWKGPCRSGFSEPKKFKCTWISSKFTCRLEDPSKSHIQIFSSNRSFVVILTFEWTWRIYDIWRYLTAQWPFNPSESQNIEILTSPLCFSSKN